MNDLIIIWTGPGVYTASASFGGGTRGPVNLGYWLTLRGITVAIIAYLRGCTDGPVGPVVVAKKVTP